VPAEDVISVSEAEAAITQKLDVLAAGGVSQPDYASIRGGASIVQKKTSPNYASWADMPTVDWVSALTCSFTLLRHSCVCALLEASCIGLRSHV
jgi:hypothetical protein